MDQELKKKQKRKKMDGNDHYDSSDAMEIEKTKKKRRHEPQAPSSSSSAFTDSPAKEVKGRHYTVTIAVAGSIILNAQSPELRTYLVGEIARAAAIFQVDEVVVYGDESSKNDRVNFDPNLFFARLLQYIETPQYLRKALFPHHSDLRFAGLLNPLDAPHHPRSHEKLVYREGVTVDPTQRPQHHHQQQQQQRKKDEKKDGRSLVNIGLKKEIRIDRSLKPGVRVTVKLNPKEDPPLTGVALAPSAPRQALGLYWGYQTRVAADLMEVLSASHYKDGYDLTIGTSERGNQSIDDNDFKLPTFHHLLIVFGGVAGIEACVDALEGLPMPGSKAHTLFDMWLNVCPDQGSRTIRTEEAVPITLARLRPLITKSGYTL